MVPGSSLPRRMVTEADDTILNLKDTTTTRSLRPKGIAKRGLGYMIGRPFFGVGVANFPRAEERSHYLQSASRRGLSVEWIAPHNTYVQVGARWDFPPLMICSHLLLGGTVGLWRLRRRLPASGNMGRGAQVLERCLLFLPISFLASQYLPVPVARLHELVAYTSSPIRRLTCWCTMSCKGAL